MTNDSGQRVVDWMRSVQGGQQQTFQNLDVQKSSASLLLTLGTGNSSKKISSENSFR